MSIAKRFVVMGVINAVIFELIVLLGRSRHVNAVETLFELFLITLVITLYDEYRAIRHVRLSGSPGGATTPRTVGAT